MATKEKLTYTDVRNAASQADALEAVNNYMTVQQGRRTRYSTKADPAQKWHTGQTFTDHDGKAYQLRVQYNADGSIRNQQKVFIGEGKVPTKKADEKIPLNYAQIIKKYDLYSKLPGIDPLESEHIKTRIKDAKGETDTVLQKQLFAEIDTTLQKEMDYNTPSAEKKKYTLEGVTAMANAMPKGPQQDEILASIGRLPKAMTQEGKFPDSYQNKLTSILSNINLLTKVPEEKDKKVTASDVLDYRTMGKTFETLAKRGFREENPGYTMEMDAPPKITKEMVNYYRLAVEGKIRTDLAGDHKVYKGQVVVSPEDIDMDRHVGSQLHLAFQNSPEAKKVPANLSESEASDKGRQAFYDYAYRIQNTTPSQSYFQLFIDKTPDREWFTREQSIYERIESIGR